jgi:hypothetical protein
VPTLSAHLAPHLASTVGDVGGDAAAGEAAVVEPIVVIRVDVLFEVALDAGEADVQVAGKRWAPALLEDQPVQRLDRTVGLWATGPDEGVAHTELVERGLEVR